MYENSLICILSSGVSRVESFGGAKKGMTGGTKGKSVDLRG